MPSISFRCWYCNRGFSVEERRIGEALQCSSCQSALRVPRHSGASSKRHTVTSWLIEAVVYGGGGGLLGFGLGLILLANTGLGAIRRGWMILAGLTLAGFLIGLFGGERGINWLGQRIRDRGH